MDELQTAPTVAIAGCLCFLAALGAPYLVVETGSAVGAYYASGALSPVIPGVLATVGLIVFAAGREGRTDPSIAAGAGLVLGLFVLGLSLAWAATVPTSLVLGLTESTLMEYHRWALVATALPVPVGAAWFARALGLI